jgi:hypothetical protein
MLGARSIFDLAREQVVLCDRAAAKRPCKDQLKSSLAGQFALVKRPSRGQQSMDRR